MPNSQARTFTGVPPRLIAAASLLIAMAALARNRAFYHDDAFITLRYARHLIAGQGPVWNPGEKVEGYTNFLHLLLTSGLGAIGFDLLTAARCVSGASWVALVALLLSAGRRIDSGAPALVPAMVAATSFPILVWILGGLETPLFTLLVACSAWLGVLAGDDLADQPAGDRGRGRSRALRGAGLRALGSGACAALAALTRPEGLIVAAVVGTTLAWQGLGRHRPGRTLLFGLAFFAVFAPFLAWRIDYYGDLLPNTFYVKGTGGGLERLADGARYAMRFFLSPPFALPLAGAGLLLASRGDRAARIDRRMIIPAGTVLLFTAYVVSVGGDHMPAYRFLAPIVPLLGLLLLFALKAVRESGREGIAAALPALLVVLAPLQLIPHALNPVKADPAAWKGGVVGRYVAGAWPAGSLVALNTAGTIPYFAADLRFIDMLGLNDRTIAHRVLPPVRTDWQRVPGHAKGDGAYVLSRRPDFIIIGPAEGTTLDDPWFLSDAEIAERGEEFLRDYRLEKEDIDVSREPGYEDYQASAAGTLTFTWYRRVERGPAAGSPSGGRP